MVPARGSGDRLAAGPGVPLAWGHEWSPEGTGAITGRVGNSKALVQGPENYSQHSVIDRNGKRAPMYN